MMFYRVRREIEVVLFIIHFLCVLVLLFLQINKYNYTASRFRRFPFSWIPQSIEDSFDSLNLNSKKKLLEFQTHWP